MKLLKELMYGITALFILHGIMYLNAKMEANQVETEYITEGNYGVVGDEEMQTINRVYGHHEVKGGFSYFFKKDLDI